MKRMFFVMGLLALLSLSVAAQEREMRWENVTALYFAATNGTDRDNALQQYLLFDERVLDRNKALLKQYQTFKQEFGQMSLNQTVPEGMKEIDEGIARIKQVMKEHPEMAEMLKEQLKEIEAQKKEFSGMTDSEVTEYTYDPATILKKLTNLAVNKKTYTGYRDIGNGIFAVTESPRFGLVYENDLTSAKIQEGKEFTWGAIDGNGRQVIPSKYKEFRETWSEQDLIILYTKQSDGSIRAGACGYDGRVRIPFIYDEAYERGTFIWTDKTPTFHFYLFKSNGKYGFIGLDGQVLQPCVYGKAEVSGFGWLVTKDWKDYGLVDFATGKLVVPIKYKGYHYDDFAKNLKMVRHDGKLDVFDENFKVIRTENAPKD